MKLLDYCVMCGASSEETDLHHVIFCGEQLADMACVACDPPRREEGVDSQQRP